jgi:hypothetical protein
MNLLLAGFWLAVVVVIFFKSQGDGKEAFFGSNWFVFSCLAMLMFVYNIARWWSIRTAKAQQQTLREALARQREQEDRTRPERTPDPNFDFREVPPR